MKKSDFKKGQEVCLYIADFSDALRQLSDKSIENRIKKGIVKSIGTKYITVINEKDWEYKFEIDNNFLEYISIGSRTYELFLTEQDVYDYINAQKDYDYISDYFSSFKYTRNHKVSANCLKAIKDIILEDLKNECN
jgi:hypothetical protein